MIIDEKNREDVITAYVYGELSKTELEVFEAKRATDADFAEEVELYLALIGDYHQEQKSTFEGWMEEISLEGTEDTQLTAEKTTIKDASIEGKSSPKVVPLFQNKTRIYAIAAALLLFLSALFLFKALSPSSLSTGDLVATHLEEIHKAPSNKMGSSEEEANWAAAKKAYEAENYERAAMSLEKIVEGGTDKAVVYFYLGLSYLYQQNTDVNKAVSVFEEAAKDGDYKNESLWYMSLAYLKNGEPNKAKEVLKEIVNKTSKEAERTFKYEEAVELLKSLNP